MFMTKLTPQQTDLKTLLDNPDQDLPKSLENVLIQDCFEELAAHEEALDNYNDLRNESEYGFAESPSTLGAYTKQKHQTRYPAIQPNYTFYPVVFNSKRTFLKNNRLRYGYWKGRPGDTNWEDLDDYEKVSIIQTLLSRTPDGKAVMPFLDVEKLWWNGSEHVNVTLDYILYREFNETLRIGKALDEALEIITKIYLINVYV